MEQLKQWASWHWYISIITAEDANFKFGAPKMQKGAKWAWPLSRVSYFQNFWTLRISGTDEDTSNLVRRLIKKSTIQHMNIRSNRYVGWVTWRYFKSWDAYIRSTGKAKDTTMKFGAQIYRQVYNKESAKLGQNGSDISHMTYFFIYCTFLYVWNGWSYENQNYHKTSVVYVMWAIL